MKIFWLAVSIYVSALNPATARVTETCDTVRGAGSANDTYNAVQFAREAVRNCLRNSKFRGSKIKAWYGPSCDTRITR